MMLDELAEIARACDLTIPVEHRRTIAHVGAGTIVANAHAPAYRKAGLTVRGVYDSDPARAAALAKAWDLPRTYATLDELLADDVVEVVDIGVPPMAQSEIVERAFAAGKDVLAQKPLALSSREAARLVALADASGRKLVVNHQMRYDEGVAAAREMLGRGWIGEPEALEMSIDIHINWRSWFAESSQLLIWYHAIHELDAIRSWFGNPESVWCTGTTSVATPGERRIMCALVYPGRLRVSLHVSTENRTGQPSGRFRIDGSAGAIRGELRRFYKPPLEGPDALEIHSSTLPTDGWLPYPCTKRWFIDAFIGPMRSLLEWIATGVEPATSARDNVATVRLVEALYRSMDSGAVQTLSTAE
jgi:predicted dehydrogenase